MRHLLEMLRHSITDEIIACRRRLQPFHFDLWWNQVFVIGVIGLALGLLLDDRELRLIGLSFAAWGFGEARNHKPDDEFPDWKDAHITGLYVRKMTTVGMLFNLVAFLLITWAVVQMVR